MVKILHYLVTFGLQRYLLPKTQIESDCPTCSPFASKIEVGSCGVLLGSPEHRVRRAIASYCNAGQWEVAKISFGEAGARVLEQEARILQELHPLAAGVPGMLGLHRGDDVMMLRMPYLTGRPIPRGAFEAALDLLNQWVTDQAAKSITEFPEWPSIESALLEHESSDPVIEKLLKVKLRPVICHGDFARWNLLRQENGKLIVLDWEWGHQNGMPGIDLAHYFLQDARLVERLSPQEAIRKTCSLLES